MNNIKFRVWDKELEEFSNYTNRDPFLDLSTGKIFFWERTRKDDGSYSGDIIIQDSGNRFVLQQYTGLLDKNGNEIFDGDIVKYRTPVHGNEISDIIVFDEGQFQTKDTCEPLMDAIHYHNSENTPIVLEIIGNIFQNPELLP